MSDESRDESATANSDAGYPSDVPSEDKPERFVGDSSNEGMTEVDDADSSDDTGDDTESTPPPADFDPADNPSNDELVAGENPE